MSDFTERIRNAGDGKDPDLKDVLRRAADEIERLTRLINIPISQPFDLAVKRQAAYLADEPGSILDQKHTPGEWGMSY